MEPKIIIKYPWKYALANVVGAKFVTNFYTSVIEMKYEKSNSSKTVDKSNK